jgi:hypothetical protein
LAILPVGGTGKVIRAEAVLVAGGRRRPTSAMPPSDIATVQALRTDLALQISRCLKRRQLTQVEAARLLDILSLP